MPGSAVTRPPGPTAAIGGLATSCPAPDGYLRQVGCLPDFLGGSGPLVGAPGRSAFDDWNTTTVGVHASVGVIAHTLVGPIFVGSTRRVRRRLAVLRAHWPRLSLTLAICHPRWTRSADLGRIWTVVCDITTAAPTAAVHDALPPTLQCLYYVFAVHALHDMRVRFE
jgi:hypothetical protein